MKKSTKKQGKVEKKHRLFAKMYVLNNYNATRAYLSINEDAKTTTAGTEGCKLLKIPNVQQYIKEFEELPVNLKITKEEIILSNIELREMSKKDGQYSSALKANELIAKMMGLNEAEKMQYSGELKFDFGFDLNDLDEEDDESEE